MATWNLYYQTEVPRGRLSKQVLNIGRFFGRPNRTPDEHAAPEWQLSRCIDGSYMLSRADDRA